MANGQCSGTAHRRKGYPARPCAQPAIAFIDGKWWCYYHNPRNPKKFGEGYSH